MKKTGSHRLIMTRDFAPTADAVRQSLESERYEIHVETLFSLYDIFPHLTISNSNAHRQFIPYPAREKPYDPDELALILHSSGSTGLPKPIPKTHKIVLQWTISGKIIPNDTTKSLALTILRLYQENRCPMGRNGFTFISHHGYLYAIIWSSRRRCCGWTVCTSGTSAADHPDAK